MDEPAYLEIVFKNGDDFEITIFDFEYDITGYDFYGTIINEDGSILKEFSRMIDPINRVVTFKMSSDNILELDYKVKKYYFRQIDASGFKKRIIEGNCRKTI